MKTLRSLRPLLAAPFILVALMYAAYYMGKSLEGFIPIWVVILALMIVSRKNDCRSSQPSERQES